MDLSSNLPKSNTGPGPEQDINGESKWARSKLPKIDEQKDSIIFQTIDLDFYIGGRYKINIFI